MNLRHISSLAFRMLSVYIGVVALQYGSLTAQMSTPAMRFSSRRNLPGWPNFAVPAVLYALAAAFLFWYAVGIAPKREDEETGTLSFDQLKKLAFLVLGAFFLISGAPLVISDVLSTMKGELFNRQPGLDRWIYDVGSSVAGLALVIANSPKGEPVPGFDEMTSHKRRM